MLTLGIDTSNYATSLAVFDTDAGEVVCDCKKFLPVKEGQLGLRQSDALFHHTAALPEMLAELSGKADLTKVAAVGVSAKPRPVEGSYMPCFLAGVSAATAFALSRALPLVQLTHQQGHIAASLWSAGRLELMRAPHLAWHLSGGTTEILLCENGRLTLLGGSLDLHAGQLVDRTGVRLHMPFPAGPSLEKLAMEGKAQGLIGVSIKGVSCNMAGAENKVMRWIEGGDMPKAQIAAEVFDFLCRSILRMIAAAGEQTGARQALLAGGVASSTLLRGMLLERAKKTRLGCRLCFARPELSGDNAVGVALLGAEAYRAERRLHG